MLCVVWAFEDNRCAEEDRQEMSDQVTVCLSDLRKVKYCVSGSKDFFVKHGLDWKYFCRHGLPAEVFESTGDAMAIKLAQVARNGR